MKTDKTINQAINNILDESIKDLNESDILDIVSFQFKTVKHAIANKQFIELPRIGKFMVKEGRDKHLSPEKRFYEPHLRSSCSELSQDDTEGTE